MTTTHHMHMNVNHMANMTKKEFDRNWKGVATDEKTGKACTYEEIIAFFTDKQQSGYLVYPFGDCDNFDPEKGCLGHEVEE